MIEVQNLTKRFGPLTAVDNISFDIEAGESVALWGKNGAGKTTALRCLLGVIPYEGSVRLGGFDTAKQGKDARRMLGFVPQEISFHDNLSVEETLYFYSRLKKTANDTEHAIGLLERLGLVDHVHKKVGDLSGGMKQRLALVIALMADPPVIILDEPTANLDVKAREGFLALLMELKQEGKTLVFSSHRLEEVTTLADRVLVIESGELIADCNPLELGDYSQSVSMLKLYFSNDEWVVPALETLSGHGYKVSKNGTGIWVQVVPLEKAKPISLLASAGFPVEDFQID